MPVEPSDGWADGGDADDQDWPGGVIWPAETDQDIPGRASGEMPGGGPGGGQASQMLVMGTVTAVSATSITIGGKRPLGDGGRHRLHPGHRPGGQHRRDQGGRPGVGPADAERRPGGRDGHPVPGPAGRRRQDALSRPARFQNLVDRDHPDGAGNGCAGSTPRRTVRLGRALSASAAHSCGMPLWQPALRQRWLPQQPVPY